MRLGQGNQVPNGPGDHIAVSLQVAFAPFLGSEYPGNVTRNRRLFRQNGDGTGFTCLHGYSQSTAIMLPVRGPLLAAGMLYEEPFMMQSLAVRPKGHLPFHFYASSRN